MAGRLRSFLWCKCLGIVHNVDMNILLHLKHWQSEHQLTPWYNRIFIKPVKKIPVVMGHEGLSLCSQESATGTNSEPVISIPCFHILFSSVHFKIIFAYNADLCRDHRQLRPPFILLQNVSKVISFCCSLWQRATSTANWARHGHPVGLHTPSWVQVPGEGPTIPPQLPLETQVSTELGVSSPIVTHIKKQTSHPFKCLSSCLLPPAWCFGPFFFS
jgi:hypothetical protein